MHSSWKLWDLIDSRPYVFEDNQKPLLFLQAYDPFALRILKAKIPTSKFYEHKLFIKLGREITTEWVEDNFLSMSLFGNPESYYILNAHEMSDGVKEKFSNIEQLILDERYIVFDYPKEDSFLKEMKKHDKAEVLKIQAPAFWEKDKLLNFLSLFLEVYLSYEAKDYFLKHVEFTIEDYYNYLYQLKINFSDLNQVSVEHLEQVVFKPKWDQFELAEYFATKQFKKFYQGMRQAKSFEEVRMLAQFLQSHLLKILDPSYSADKNRLTKYDKDILKQHDLWKAADIHKAMVYFVELEIKAKSKDNSVFDLLQRDLLRLSF